MRVSQSRILASFEKNKFEYKSFKIESNNITMIGVRFLGKFHFLSDLSIKWCNFGSDI